MNDRVVYVLTALQYSSHQKAADSLYVAAQTVSKAVAEEERRLGKKLFQRKGRGVEPTEFGLAYLDSAKDLMEAQREFDKSLAMFEERGAEGLSLSLCIGQVPFRGSFTEWFSPERFRAVNPHIALQVLYYTPDVSAAMLNYRRVDAALIPSSFEIPKTHVLGTSRVPLSALVAEDSPLGHKGSIGIDDLASLTVSLPLYDEVTATIRDAVEKAGVQGVGFVSVPLSIGGLTDFILDGGVVLSGPCNDLTKYDSRLVQVPFSGDQETTMSWSLTVSDNLSDILLEGLLASL